MIDDGRPLFVQIAESVEDSIVDGSLAEEAQAPSTNELAAFHRINPATAAKGIAMLTDKGVLHKRRGIGMAASRAWTSRAALRVTLFLMVTCGRHGARSWGVNNP